MAADRCRLDLAEVVVVADQTLGQHDVADHIVACGAVARETSGVLAVELVGGLRGLGHGVGARAQAQEAVAAVGRGGGGGGDGVAQVVPAGQGHGHAAQTLFGALLGAVIVVVTVDEATDLRADQFTEVVVGAVRAGRERDAADHVVGGRAAASGAGGVLAIQIGAGLRRFGHAVVARAQAGEFIEPGRIRRGGGRDGDTAVVGAGQVDSDATDGRLAAAPHAIVAEVFVDVAADLGGQHFAEVVVVADLAGGQHDAADRIVDRGVAAGRAGGVLAVELVGGLRGLGHGVGARAQAGEAVRAVGVGGGGGGHRLVQVIGARKRDDDARQTLFSDLFDSVVVVVAVNESVDGGIGLEDQACIDRLVGLVVGQRDDLAQAGGRVGIAVGGVVAACIAAGEGIGRRDELDLVVACTQAGELVEAMFDSRGAEIVAGAGAGHLHAVGVVQLDDHVVDTGFAGVLGAVAVAVQPDIVAQLGTLQLHHQRLDVAVGVDDGREEGVDRLHALAAGHSCLR